VVSEAAPHNPKNRQERERRHDADASLESQENSSPDPFKPGKSKIVD
jgi:hypothetical protein